MADAAQPDSQKQILSMTFRLNGKEQRLEISSHELLIDLLRKRIGLTGTKQSCDVQVCGACTVLIDGRPVSSCSTLAFEAMGRDVLTIEGLAEGGRLHPLQQAFLEYGGFQCGFCTPGMILTAKSLLDQKPDPTDEEIIHFMDGNLCRCTGYKGILDSIRAAATLLRR